MKMEEKITKVKLDVNSTQALFDFHDNDRRELWETGLSFAYYQFVS